MASAASAGFPNTSPSKASTESQPNTAVIEASVQASRMHQLGWIGVMNRVFIDATHLHPMGDRRLLKQTPSGWRRGGKQEHGPAWIEKR